MGRKRIELGAGADDRIVAMMARGLGASAIAHELGGSRATVARRMKELRAGVPAMRAARRASVTAKPAPLPVDAAEISDSTPLEQIAAWLAMAREEADAARASGDVDAMGKMLRIASTLLGLQQKSTPAARPDPNENPDFVEAADVGWEKLHARIDAIVREVRG